MARAMPLRRGTTWSAQAIVRASRDGDGVSAPTASDRGAGAGPGGAAGSGTAVDGGPDAPAAGSARRARAPRAARAVALAAGAPGAAGALARGGDSAAAR